MPYVGAPRCALDIKIAAVLYYTSTLMISVRPDQHTGVTEEEEKEMALIASRPSFTFLDGELEHLYELAAKIGREAFAAAASNGAGASGRA